MRASMWSYPWDLDDCGIEYALDDMRENGLDGISMITSYHAGRFLCLRSPKRKVYFPEDGTLYYPADMKNFEHLKIKPKVSRFTQEHPRFFNQLFDAADKRGMKVSGWTVCLHNTRIGMAWPDTCVHNAYGDVVYYNQCPSNPDARAYMRALLGDMCAQLPLHAVELESMNFMGHAHEFHHEKDAIGLNALQDFLLSLCFCESCMSRAQAQGVDVLWARETVRTLLEQLTRDQFSAQETARFLKEGIDYFKDMPALHEYLCWRPTVITSLVEEVHEAVGGRALLYFLSLLPHSGSWLFGVDLKAITARCEGALVCSYDCDETQARADIAESQRDFAPGSQLLIGMRCFMPEYENAEAFLRKVKAAKEMGVEDFRFYNYGLIPRAQLEWVKRAGQV